ncbi:uncharacterized protein LOC117316664 [Pecten maximus]|uniref:uncharacterized protein LOC117316664 n=1 Tax=Pecten maximus TaxID=6579 RepID=UPI0014588E7C|nr:uncharacterized protein LOC117316664 [Pecten maximus]
MSSTSPNNGSTISTSPASSHHPPLRVPPKVTTPSTSVFDGEGGKTILALIVLVFVILLVLIGVICLGIWMYNKMYRKAIEKQELFEKSKTKTVATQTRLTGRHMEEYIRRMDTVYMSTYKGTQLPGRLDLPCQVAPKRPHPIHRALAKILSY